MQLLNILIQLAFLVLTQLARTCIIEIDVLVEHKTKIDLDTKTITFPYLDGKPALRIVQDEKKENQEGHYKLIDIESLTDETEKIEDVSRSIESEEVTKLPLHINWQEIRKKINESQNLREEEKEELGKILWTRRRVFRKEPGVLKKYQHILKKREGQPFVGRSYAIPMSHREKVDQEIQRMLSMDIIQRSNTPYINPVVPVINKDGTICLCLGSRRIKEILIEDWECPQPVEVLFQKCKSMNVILNLDMASSFWHVPLHSNSR